MPEGAQERIPFSIKLDGEIHPDNIEALVLSVSRLATSLNVTIEMTEPAAVEPERELTKQDFGETWNVHAAGQAWRVLRLLAEEHPDFPLQLLPNETGTGQIAKGNLRDALRWLELNPPKKGPGSVALSTILERLDQDHRPYRT